MCVCERMCVLRENVCVCVCVCVRERERESGSRILVEVRVEALAHLPTLWEVRVREDDGQLRPCPKAWRVEGGGRRVEGEGWRV